MKTDKRLNIRLITAIVRAAEKVGGVHNLEMPGRRKKWRTSTGVCMGNMWLYFNNSITHSTDIIKM